MRIRIERLSKEMLRVPPGSLLSITNTLRTTLSLLLLLLLRLLLRLWLRLLLRLDGDVGRRRNGGRLLPRPSLASGSRVDKGFPIGVVGLRRKRWRDMALEDFVVV